MRRLLALGLAASLLTGCAQRELGSKTPYVAVVPSEPNGKEITYDCPKLGGELQGEEIGRVTVGQTLKLKMDWNNDGIDDAMKFHYNGDLGVLVAKTALRDDFTEMDRLSTGINFTGLLYKYAFGPAVVHSADFNGDGIADIRAVRVKDDICTGRYFEGKGGGKFIK